MAETKITKELFVLRYHKQTAQSVTFYALNLEDAMRIGKDYCDTFRLRFLHVGPIAEDLEEIIRKKKESMK